MIRLVRSENSAVHAAMHRNRFDAIYVHGVVPAGNVKNGRFTTTFHQAERAGIRWFQL